MTFEMLLVIAELCRATGSGSMSLNAEYGSSAFNRQRECQKRIISCLPRKPMPITAEDLVRCI